MSRRSASRAPSLLLGFSVLVSACEEDDPHFDLGTQNGASSALPDGALVPGSALDGALPGYDAQVPYFDASVFDGGVLPALDASVTFDGGLFDGGLDAAPDAAQHDASAPSDAAGDAHAPTDASVDASDGTTARVRYTTDVAAIMSAQCVRCHVSAGAAPFALGTYAEVSTRAAQIVSATAANRMPICYPGQAECGLTDAQKATLAAWAAGGAPE